MIRCILVCLVLAAIPAQAADLMADANWSSLAGDRTAHKVGDVLTILIYENASATNSANSSLAKSSNLHAQAQAGSSTDNSASFALGDGSLNSGSTGRSGQMVAQISAVVDEVLSNGDLRISGSQLLNINGEQTKIHLKGRVRLADIAADNTVLSIRLADATIDYDGQGFVSRSAQPGVLTRIFHWLGIP